MKYDRSFFDTPVDRMGTNCEKWDALRRREGSDLLPMWVADMDFRCADENVQALTARVAHPVYGYTEQSDAAIEAMLGSFWLSMVAVRPSDTAAVRAALRALWSHRMG